MAQICVIYNYIIPEIKQIIKLTLKNVLTII